MKKTAMFVSILFALVVMMTAFSSVALAGDKLINLPVSKVYLKTDKNGKPFATIICTEARKLNGIEYQTDVVVTAFGINYEQASQMKEGDTLKAIIRTRDFGGNTSYNVLQFTP
jgi:hypothetical protein